MEANMGALLRYVLDLNNKLTMTRNDWLEEILTLTGEIKTYSAVINALKNNPEAWKKRMAVPDMSTRPSDLRMCLPHIPL